MGAYYNSAIAVSDKKETESHTLIVGKSDNNKKFFEHNYLCCLPDHLLSCLKHNDKFYYGEFCDYVEDPLLNRKNIKKTDTLGFWTRYFDTEKLLNINDVENIYDEEDITAYDFTSDDDGLNDLVLENDTTKLRTNIIDKKYTTENRKTYPKEICTVNEFVDSIKTELKTNVKMQDMLKKTNTTETKFLTLFEEYLNYRQEKYVYFDNSIIINEEKKEYVDFLHANFTLIYYEFINVLEDKNMLGINFKDLNCIYYIHPLAFLSTNSTDIEGGGDIEKTNYGESGDMVKGAWFNDELIIDRKRMTDLTGYKNLTPLNFVFTECANII